MMIVMYFNLEALEQKKKHAHKSTSELQLVVNSGGNTPHISRSKNHDST